MMIGIIALTAIAISIAQSYELLKSLKKQSGRKIVILTSVGTILTGVFWAKDSTFKAY